jgi:hypothetical protein
VKKNDPILKNSTATNENSASDEKLRTFTAKNEIPSHMKQNEEI